MKKLTLAQSQYWLLAALLFMTPFISQAQEAEAGPSTFNGSYTLWTAIIIGVVASVLTLLNAKKLGGTISQVLWFLGGGMLLVVLGFLSVVVAWAPEATQAIVHDILFIVGYILMALGGLRLYRLNSSISRASY